MILALGSCVGNDDVTTEKEVAIKQEDGKVLSDESKKEKDKKQEEKKDDNKQVEGTVNEEKSESTAATGENQNSEQKESNAEAQKQAQLSSLIKNLDCRQPLFPEWSMATPLSCRMEEKCV